MHVVRQPSLYFLKGYFARLMCAEECEVRVDLRLERLSLMLQQVTEGHAHRSYNGQ